MKDLVSLPVSKLRRLLNTYTENKYKGSTSWYFPNKQSTYCLVAHIDTVFDTIKEQYTIPIGYDDRAGVYGCIQMYMKHGCSVLLTDYEESGGKGAHEACDVFYQYLKNYAFFVELDRRNYLEAVYYNNEPEEFRNIFTTLGFREAWGTYSDVSTIGFYLNVPCVNLSVGFYKEHTQQEYFQQKALDETMKRLVLLNKGLENRRFGIRRFIPSSPYSIKDTSNSIYNNPYDDSSLYYKAILRGLKKQDYSYYDKWAN